MAKKVVIPQSLSNYLDGVRRVEVNGDTVGNVLNELVRRYPVMHPFLLDEDGEIIQSLNVFLNAVEIRSLEGTDTPLEDEDVIILVTPISGG